GVLDVEEGTELLGGFADRRLRGLQVELGELLEAFEGLEGEGPVAFNRGFLDLDQLFGGLEHCALLDRRIRGEATICHVDGASHKTHSMGGGGGSQSFSCATQQMDVPEFGQIS